MTEEYTIPLSRIIKELSLREVHMPKTAEEILIVSRDVIRPGLELYGFCDYFDPKRITAHDAAKVVILDFTDLLNIDNSAMDILAGFIRALKRRNHELIVAGASGHPLAQLQRTGIAAALGKNMVPDMVFAEHRARELMTEIATRETSGKPLV